MNNTPEKWEVEFDNKFTEKCKEDGLMYYDGPSGQYSDVWFGPTDLKSFIRQALHTQRQEIKNEILKRSAKIKKEVLADIIHLLEEGK